MAFIIKPLVTEKMTKITERSTQSRRLRASNKKSAERLGAVEETFSYVVKRKGKPDEHKEKKIFVYEKPARQRYGFIVKPEANKIEIKQEVEKTFNVTVEDVNTIRYTGKCSRRYTKAGLVKGQKSAYKKAIVTLKPGDEIDIYSNIEV
jgi:large subunit ribosomal protein L23